MDTLVKSKILSEFFDYINNWVFNYNIEAKKIPLFDPVFTRTWNTNQKQHFVRVFYHVRGHFNDFMWYLANHADDKETKDLILENMNEEFNGSAKSHEQMYFDFADSLGVDVKDEFVKEEYYIDSIRRFNKEHLMWLHNNDSEGRIAAFSAYEKLDNVDYMLLLDLVESFNIDRKGKVFFKVHSKVTHFESTQNKLSSIWASSPEKVMKAFDFIAQHQLKMWYDVFQEVSNVN